MLPEWRAFFITLAILCWLIGAFKAAEGGRFQRFSPIQLACVGWALFAFPFLWDAASEGF